MTTEPHVPQDFSDLSLSIDVFLNLLIVTETSCSRSQPRRFSTFFEGVGLSVFKAEAFSYTQIKEMHEYMKAHVANVTDLVEL